MARVYGIHEIELNPGVTPEEFERFMREEVMGLPVAEGTRYRVCRGDRGERDGQYLVIIEADSVEQRDRYYPAANVPSEEARRRERQFAAVIETWKTLATYPSARYTDDVELEG